MTQQTPPPVPGRTQPPPQQNPKSNTCLIVMIVLGACAVIILPVIAILAAIAIPNFLEAQTRAKVSRSKADMRSMATAVEAYYVDNNSYPDYMVQTTTPIAYISRLPQDPFASGSPLKYQMSTVKKGDEKIQKYVVYSVGPDTILSLNANNVEERFAVDPDNVQAGFLDVMYDPTNGTTSYGDVMHFSW